MAKYPIDPILALILSRVFEDLAKAIFIAGFVVPNYERELATAAEYNVVLLKSFANGILFLVLAYKFAKVSKKKGNK